MLAEKPRYPERCMAHLGLCPHGAPGSLGSLDLGSAHCFELWQPQCGPSTGNTPHTCWWHLLGVSVPLHSTTEQGSPNKWPLSPTQIRAEIKHWRELQSEEGKLKKKKKKKERKKGELPRKYEVQQIKTLQLMLTGALEQAQEKNKGLSDTELTPHCQQWLQRNS